MAKDRSEFETNQRASTLLGQILPRGGGLASMAGVTPGGGLTQAYGVPAGALTAKHQINPANVGSPAEREDGLVDAGTSEPGRVMAGASGGDLSERSGPQVIQPNLEALSGLMRIKPQMANQVMDALRGYNTSALQTIKARNDAMGVAAHYVKYRDEGGKLVLTTPQDRQARYEAAKDHLVANGWSSDELARVDLSDEGLDRYERQALGYDQMIGNELASRRLQNDVEDDAAVPAGVAQVARTIDPVRRDTNSLGDEIRARLPVLSQGLPAERNVWGQQITTDRVGPDVLSPVTASTRLNDPVNTEMLRLGATATNFPKAHTVDGKRVNYTPQEYEQLAAKAGQDAYTRIAALIGGTGWRKMTPEARQNAVQKAVREARQDARGGRATRATRAAWDQFEPAKTKPGSAPSEWDQFDKLDQPDIVRDLERHIPGVRMQSGFRTKAYQEDMKRRGYHPADDSHHLEGSSLDLLPPPGKSMRWLKAMVREYRADARLLDEGDHLHVTFPGWFGAPAFGGAKAAGLHNPVE